MSQVTGYRLLAEYNQWMNDRLMGAAGMLGEDELARDRGAFFKSVLGTFNHGLGGDTIWLKRFATGFDRLTSLAPVAQLPSPPTLDALLYPRWDEFVAARQSLDRLILGFSAQLDEGMLAAPLSYTNIRGRPARKPFDQLLLHFFNHQTHHRGQITTLLTQAGVEVGVTDLLMCIDDI